MSIDLSSHFDGYNLTYSLSLDNGDEAVNTTVTNARQVLSFEDYKTYGFLAAR